MPDVILDIVAENSPPPMTAELRTQLAELMPDPRTGKKPSAQQLFMYRMRRDGRQNELKDRIKAIMYPKDGTQGMNWPNAMRQACKEFGYRSSAEEKMLAQDFINKHTLKELPPTIAEKEALEAAIESIAILTFEQMLERMPAQVDDQEEQRWIQQHPAMARSARQKPGSKKDVKLRATDLAGAPSRRAVIELQNWCNNPQKFFEKVISERVKRQDEEENKKSAYDPNVDTKEITQLLRELTGK